MHEASGGRVPGTLWCVEANNELFARKPLYGCNSRIFDEQSAAIFLRVCVVHCTSIVLATVERTAMRTATPLVT